MITKAEILKILRIQKDVLKEYGVKSIGLFGSYSHQKQGKNSDIDILIDFYSEKETFDNFISVCDVLESAFPGNKLDIVTKNGLSKYIGSYILNETEYV